MFDKRLFISTLLICCGVIYAGQINYNNVCALIEPGTLVASASSCNEYYACQSGGAVLQTCPSGQSFSKDNQFCVPASQSTCGQAPCANEAVGTWAADPNSCNGFYYCSATGAMHANCPQNENFDPTTQTCKYAASYPCSPSNANSSDSGDSSINLCTLMPNNKIFGSATSCNGYYYCKNNAITAGTCPEGLSYNPSNGYCLDNSTVSCSQVTYDPELSNQVSGGGSCNNTGARTQALPRCNAYYECNGSNNVIKYCTNGQYFDAKSGNCMSRADAFNPNCDRCYGTTASYVTAANAACNQWLYCVNGVEKGSGSCGNGTYFEESAGACVVGDKNTPYSWCSTPPTTSTNSTNPVVTP